jgi:hypothetical protein
MRPRVSVHTSKERKRLFGETICLHVVPTAHRRLSHQGEDMPLSERITCFSPKSKTRFEVPGCLREITLLVGQHSESGAGPCGCRIGDTEIIAKDALQPRPSFAELATHAPIKGEPARQSAGLETVPPAHRSHQHDPAIVVQHVEVGV